MPCKQLVAHKADTSPGSALGTRPLDCLRIPLVAVSSMTPAPFHGHSSTETQVLASNKLLLLCTRSPLASILSKTYAVLAWCWFENPAGLKGSFEGNGGAVHLCLVLCSWKSISRTALVPVPGQRRQTDARSAWAKQLSPGLLLGNPARHKDSGDSVVGDKVGHEPGGAASAVHIPALAAGVLEVAGSLSSGLFHPAQSFCTKP